jgi:hypothetical protein
MGLNAATIEYLLSKGLTGEDLLAVAQRMEKRADNTNARRQARHRAKRKGAKDSNAVTVTPVTPPNDIDILTPREVSEAKASSPQPWALPVGVSLQVWTDFLSNRKRKRLGQTPSAWKTFNDDLARVSAQTGIPPPKLIELCTGKGWGGIYDPREQNHEQRSIPRARPNLTDLHRAATAASRDLEDRGGAGVALPAIGNG